MTLLDEAIAGAPSWSKSEQAEALLNIILHEIQEFDLDVHPRCRAALEAGYGLRRIEGEELAAGSLTARLNRAAASGVFGGSPDGGRRAWNKAVWELSDRIESRLRELAAHPRGWSRFAPGASGGIETAALGYDVASLVPVVVSRCIKTHFYRGKGLRRVVTEREVVATEHGVEQFTVRALSSRSTVEEILIRPVLNCRLADGPRRHVVDFGNVMLEEDLLFAHPLAKGERYFFAEEVLFENETHDTPMASIQVSTHGIWAEGLTMRVQFDDSVRPTSIWYFAEVPDAKRFLRPPPGDMRDLSLKLTKHGYFEFTFREPCMPLAKYGIAWEWPT